MPKAKVNGVEVEFEARQLRFAWCEVGVDLGSPTVGQGRRRQGRQSVGAICAVVLVVHRQKKEGLA